MNTHTLTDPDCPQSVRDQINGGVTQEARELVTAIGDANSYAEAHLIATQALTTAQAEREQLEARVKELDLLVRQFAYDLAKERSEPAPAWSVDSGNMFESAMFERASTALQEKRP